MLLTMENVKKTYGDRMLLDGVTMYVKAGDRIGVIGVNGCGKSTLMKVAACREEPDSGIVRYNPNLRVGYLSQDMVDDPELTIMEQVFENADERARAAEEYEAVEILTRLGIKDTGKKMGELSGGQRKRVALASVLVHPADLLILDEPTNHLDAEMISWLEKYLSRFNGGLLLVTHDRYFLENTVTSTAEISFGKFYTYDGGYSAYLNGKAQREERQRASERKRQSTLRRELAWVLQGPCARSTKSRERLERYEALKAQQPPEFHGSMEAINAISSRLGKKTIIFNNVTKAYGDNVVIKDFSFTMLRDERLGIVGTNGSGKTTLLNLMAGYIQPDEGSVETGTTVKIGYFSQHGAELDGRLKAVEYVKEQGDSIETPEGTVSAVRLMEKFLFGPDLQYKRISDLSGGEKRRLFLLGILASQPNVLLLDEPTNDLDIPTLLVLEDYLQNFTGAVAAVSHDRHFLDRVCRRTFAVMPDGEVKEVPGGYTAYAEEMEGLQKAAGISGADKPDAAQEWKNRERPKKLKFSFKEQREFETIDDDIAALEEQIRDVEAQIAACGADYVKLQELTAQQEKLKSALEEKMERWVYLNDLAEQIAAAEN